MHLISAIEQLAGHSLERREGQRVRQSCLFGEVARITPMALAEDQAAQLRLRIILPQALLLFETTARCRRVFLVERNRQ